MATIAGLISHSRASVEEFKCVHCGFIGGPDDIWECWCGDVFDCCWECGEEQYSLKPDRLGPEHKNCGQDDYDDMLEDVGDEYGF